MHCVSISASIDIYIGFRKLNTHTHTLSDKVLSTFKGRPLLLLITFFRECIACCDETHKIQLQFHFILATFNTIDTIFKAFINTFTVLAMDHHNLQKCIRPNHSGPGCKEENPAPQLWLLTTIWHKSRTKGSQV